MTQDTAAILVAGGKGLRFGGRVRKQYLPLNKRPILWWSLSAFEKSPSIKSIALVVPADDVIRLCALRKRWGFQKLAAIVPGGVTRADSVREGLRALPEEIRYIAVHDAVRPLVEPVLIEAVIRAARKSKAALAACPSKDTVKIAGPGDFVKATPPRETVWLAQTPQVFERKLLVRAHGLTSPRRKPGSIRIDSGFRRNDLITDDSMLVERLGVRVKLIESPPENMKVTVPSDYVMARQILEDRRR